MLRRFSALMVFCLAFRAFTAADEPTMGRWTALPVDRGKDWVFDMVVDPTETIWISTKDGLCRWDGTEFIETSRPANTTGRASLFGNPQRGAYALCPSLGRNPTLRVYKLLGENISFLTELPHRYTNEAYAGTDETLWIVNSDRLAVFANGQWDIVATRFERVPKLLDNGKRQGMLDEDTLYTLSEGGKIVTTVLPIPPLSEEENRHQVFPEAAFLGDDRLFIFFPYQKDFLVYTLVKPTLVPGHSLPTKVAEIRMNSDFRSMPDGSLCTLGYSIKTSQRALYRIGTDYSVELIPGSEGIGRLSSASSYRSRDNSLIATDGTFWANDWDDTLIRFSQGQTTHYDWRDGYFGGNARLMQEGKDGRIYMATRETIMIFDPREDAGPLPAWTEDWQEFEVFPYNYAPDRSGGLWARLSDHADRVSYWNGKAWSHFPLPEGTSYEHRFCTDSRGHLLIEMRQAKNKRAYCDFAVGKEVCQYPTQEALLEAAAKDGCRWGDYGGMTRNNIVITSDGKIINTWLNRYFNGEEWTDISALHTNRLGAAAFESLQYGFLVRFEDSFYAPKDDWFEQVARLGDEKMHWMIGPTSVQPYEKELIDSHPGTYLPLTNRGKGSVALSPSGTALRSRFAKLRPSSRGGHWIFTSGSAPMRVLGRYEFPYDITNTPASGNTAANLLTEDATGNLYLGTNRRIFMRRPPKIDFAPDAPLTAAEGFVEAAFNITCPTLDPKGIRLFARFKGGEWEYRPGPRIRLAVPAEGPADEIEVVAMDPLGTVTKPVVFNVGPETVP